MFSKCVLLLTVFFMLPASARGGITTINPATKEQELVLIPTERERNMGRNIDRKVREHFDKPVDPIMRERVKRIGAALAAHSDRMDITYHFELLAHEDEDFYNAFAAPGGYIYIFEDLVELAETDDRIAAVLAHEMGHVEARHSVKRAQGNIGITALMILGSQMRTERDDYRRAQTAIGQLMASYSREDEREADELSVRYLRKAGYEPEAAIEILELLRDVRLEGPIRRYTYFRSHPYLSERIANLRRHVKGGLDFNAYINIIDEDKFRPYN